MTQETLAQLDDVLSELPLEEILDSLLDNYDGLPVIGYLARKGGFAPMLRAMSTTAGDLKDENMGKPATTTDYVKIKMTLAYTADNVMAMENRIARYKDVPASRQPHPPAKQQKEMPRPRTPTPEAERPISEVTPGALRTRAALAEARMGSKDDLRERASDMLKQRHKSKRKAGRPKGSKNKK